VQRQPTSSIHRSELVSLTRGLPGQVPLTPQGYGDLDPKEETIYQHSRVSCGCIEHEIKAYNHYQWVSSTVQIFNSLPPKSKFINPHLKVHMSSFAAQKYLT